MNSRSLNILAISAFFCAIFAYLTQPIADPDFWWHLATGRWMWDSTSLMQEDVLGMAHNASITMRESFVLKQYWLGQVIMYAVHYISGFGGLIIMRAAVLTGMFMLTWKLMRERGAGIAVSVVIIWIAVMLVVKEIHYIGLRPQMFSSLLSIFVLFTLERMRQGNRIALYILPVTMLVWANMHGGFMLGDVLIVIYILCSFAFKGSYRINKRFYISCVTTLLVSGINPNGYVAFLSVLLTFVEVQSISYWASIIESQSLFSHAGYSGIVERMPFLSALVIISLASYILNLRNIKKWDFTLLALFALVTFMGYKAIRYIIFFGPIAAIVAGVNIAQALRWLEGFTPSILKDRKYIAQGIAVAGVIIVLALSVDIARNAYAKTAFKAGRPLYFAEHTGAADFVKSAGMRGNIFNDYTQGGYLIWRLAPDVKVYTDGRALSLSAFEMFRKVVDNPFMPHPDNTSRKVYEYELWRNNIDVVLISGCDRVSGVTIALNLALLNDRTWHLVYADADSLVYMRQTPSTEVFIKNNKRPDSEAYTNILIMASRVLKGSYGHMMPGVKLSMAIGHNGRGEYSEALKWIEDYLRSNPSSTYANELKYTIRMKLRRAQALGDVVQ